MPQWLLKQPLSQIMAIKLEFNSFVQVHKLSIYDLELFGGHLLFSHCSLVEMCWC